MPFKFRIYNIKIVILVIIILSSIFSSVSVLAHSPSDMVLEYDFQEQKLNVTITHNTPTPNQHYIKKVEVWVNNDLKISQEYTSQPTLSTFTYQYNLSAEDVDVIKVTATCSISGDITEELIVIDPTIKDFTVTVTPEIIELMENFEQDFNVEVKYDGKPLENVTLEVSATYGTITWPPQVPNEPYNFLYTAPEVALDTTEKINITISKIGFQTEYIEFNFTIKDQDSPGIKDMTLQISPIITELNENKDQVFTLNISTNGEPVEKPTLTITTSLGVISGRKELSTGRYEFTYLGTEVIQDTDVTISIIAKKDGFNDGILNIQFTVLNQPSADPRKTQDGKISDGEYKFNVELDGDEYILHWRINDNIIKIALEAETTGWVAIGFEPTSKMKDADMVFGWVDSRGEPFILDAYSQGEFGPHPPDGNDDILTYGGSEKNGKTIIEFERYLTTDDFEDKNIPKDGEFNIIWAVGGDDDFTSSHTNRGYGTIDLATGQYQAGFELWRVHLIFMMIGFVTLITGNLIALGLRKKRWWLKAHRALGAVGAAFGAVGVIIAIIMVEMAGTGHIRFLHSLLGVATVILLVKTPIIGYLISRSGSVKKSKNIRTYHRWIGRITLVFMLGNVVSGLILTGII